MRNNKKSWRNEMKLTVAARISSMGSAHVSSAVHDSANLPARFPSLSTKCDSQTAGAVATVRHSNRQPWQQAAKMTSDMTTKQEEQVMLGMRTLVPERRQTNSGAQGREIGERKNTESSRPVDSPTVPTCPAGPLGRAKGTGRTQGNREEDVNENQGWKAQAEANGNVARWASERWVYATERGRWRQRSPGSFQPRAGPARSRSKRRLRRGQRPVASGPPAAAMALGEGSGRLPGARGPEPYCGRLSARRCTATPGARAAAKGSLSAEPQRRSVRDCYVTTTTSRGRTRVDEWTPQAPPLGLRAAGGGAKGRTLPLGAGPGAGRRVPWVGLRWRNPVVLSAAQRGSERKARVREVETNVKSRSVVRLCVSETSLPKGSYWAL